jgi:membrane-anchored protein YejM (alkaline phosphatase superfamily)
MSICPSPGNGGARNYGNAFLPAKYQATTIGKAGTPLRGESIRNLKNPWFTNKRQQRQMAFLQSLNEEQSQQVHDKSELEAVIQSYELAWRMQNNVPDVLDLTEENEATLDLYGIREKETADFGRQCLMARRLCESGVRFIQVTYGDGTANPAWDQHSDLPKHAKHAKAVDKPIAGLLEDLKQRGLLEDTIVWYCGEFGRTPYAQKNGTGRDHNPNGFTTWLAGNGVRSGFQYGATDEFGHRAVSNKVHMHDLHATLLYLLGIDHTRLTYRYAGRDFRLTDVHGKVVNSIFS